MKSQPICMTCKHYLPNKTIGNLHCKAYPDGIPIEIITGKVDHNQPYIGDNGIQYESVFATKDQMKSSVSETKPDNLKGEDVKMSDELMALYEAAEKTMIEVLTKNKK